MRIDRLTKILLGIVSVLLFLNLLQGLFTARPAVAEKSNSEIGRYQVSAWAAQSGSYTHHNGYYIIDTTTGRVTDSKAEVHGAEK